MYLSAPPLLSPSILGEELFLYLAVSSAAVSAALIREEGKVQKPVHFISWALRGAEERYPQMEKLAFTLVTAARKLKPYFQVHTINVLTNKPLRQILADFVAEFTTAKDQGAEEMPVWRVHTDGSSNKHAGGVGVVLHTPEGDKIKCMICLDFTTTNNEAEYEALVAGLDLAIAARAKSAVVYSDS
ncbi:uncharacterized protein LOC142644182 [Castanea sativa]|uniref:uncharacterized protein LOC142644182 n=1 Tax=Castanea sativa TaxID=21020 RepID=UPI003F64CEC7